MLSLLIMIEKKYKCLVNIAFNTRRKTGSFNHSHDLSSPSDTKKDLDKNLLNIFKLVDRIA